MLVINMGVHPKQSLENGLHNGLEVGRELDTNLARKKGLVVQLVLHPCHQIIDVFRSRALDRLFHRLPICPMVLVLGPGRHDWATIFGAELGNGSIEHINLIEKVDRVYGNPLINIFTFWQLHGQSQVPCICYAFLINSQRILFFEKKP